MIRIRKFTKTSLIVSAVMLLLLTIVLPLFVNGMSGTTYADGEQFILNFTDSGTDQKALDSCLGTNSATTTCTTDQLNTLFVFAKGGVFGSSPVQMNYEAHESNTGSIAPNDVPFVGNYTCGNYSVSALVNLTNLNNLEQGSYKTYVYLINVRNTATGQDTTEASSDGDSYLTASDIKSSGIPASCQPSPLENGSNNVSTTTGNFTKLSAAQKAKWPGVASPKPVAPPTSGPTSSTSASTPTCEASGFSLSWIMCPIIEGAANATDGIYHNIVQPLLQTKPIELTNPASDPTHTYDIWSNFRVYGDIFLVIALLVIVFGESIGGGLIDAYSAKKILPRLLIAAILINLSIYLVALAVDLTNILGGGIAALIEVPFKTAEAAPGAYAIHIGGASGDIMGALLGGGVWAIVAGGGALIEFLLLMLVIPAFLTFVAIMVTVILRQGLIILLVLVSPVAFALYCLPNTEQYFRKWWDLLLRTLLVYPLIAILFALGNIMSVTINSTASGISGAFTAILSVFALFVPLFLIPYSFRIAGGLLGRFHDLATNARQRAHEGIKGNASDPNSWRRTSRDKVRQRYAEKGMDAAGLRTNFIPPTNPLTRSGRSQWRKNREARRATSRTQLGQDFFEGNNVAKANKGNDQFYLALANPDLAQRKRDDPKTSDVERASWEQAIGNANIVPSRRSPAVRMAAAQQLAATGFQYGQGQQGYNELAETMASITGAELVKDGAGNVVSATGDRAGAYSDAMDNSQYNLRNAGRYDLGGINRGAGYSPEVGLSKVDPYTLASRAKPESVRAKGQLMRQSITRAQSAAAAGDTNTYNAEMMKASIHQQELNTGWDAATGGNKQAFLEELNTSGPELERWNGLNTGQKREARENFVAGKSTGFTPQEEARGWRTVETPVTNRDIARTESQGARRPNPSELDEK